MTGTGSTARKHAAAELFGRDAEIQEITTRLLEPGLRGAVIVGAEGLGKSALADHVLERLDGIVSASFIHGSPVLSRMPYGVLSPYLEAAGPDDMVSPLAVLRTLRRYFRRISETGGPQPLLVIDDAQCLDEASCHLLTQLAMSGEIRLLVLTRPRAGRIHELLSLAHDGMLARIELAPLSPEAVHDVCRSVLGGPVLRATSALLATVSGGNPLYLKAVLTQSRRLGRLSKGNGAWFLCGEPDGLDAAVLDLVKGQLGHRTPDERTTLEVLALAQPLPRVLLSAVCGPAAVHALLADGLIAAEPGAEELLRLSQPLHAEAIRSLVPAARSAALRARVLERIADDAGPDCSGPAERDAWLRRLEWALDCGDTVTGEDLVRAARMANDAGRSRLALRCGAAVQDLPHKLLARVEIAAASVETADYDQAGALLEGLFEPNQPTAAPDQVTLQRAALAAARLYRRSGHGAKLETLADAWCRASGEVAARSGAGEQPDPAAAAGAEVLRTLALMEQGQYERAYERLVPCTDRPLPAHGGSEAQLAVTSHSLLAEILVARGGISAALEHSGLALDLISRYGGELHADCGAVVVRHAQALLHGGHLAELERLLHAKLASPAHRLIAFGGTLGVFEGAVELHQGRLHEALACLHPAVEALRMSDPEVMLPYALGLAGYASTVLGDRSQTARYAAELRNLAPRGSRPLWLVGRAYAAAAVATHETGGAPAELAEIAALARAEGLLSAEKDILELALALGDLAQAGRLVEVAAAFEGGEAQALHAYAAAVVSGDPDQMVAAADEAVKHRKYLLAVESIGHAIRFYGAHGNLRRQRALIQQLRRRRGELAGVTVSYLSPALHLVRLTRREHEIVDLLLLGAGTKDVAAHFTLSQRTVEGHVYRIYVKLGISRRADLEPAYRALEPGASPAAHS